MSYTRRNKCVDWIPAKFDLTQPQNTISCTILTIGCLLLRPPPIDGASGR